MVSAAIAGFAISSPTAITDTTRPIPMRTPLPLRSKRIETRNFLICEMANRICIAVNTDIFNQIGGHIRAESGGRSPSTLLPACFDLDRALHRPLGLDGSLLAGINSLSVLTPHLGGVDDGLPSLRAIGLHHANTGFP